MSGCEWCEHDGIPFLFVDLGTTDEATLLDRLATLESMVAAAEGGIRIHVAVAGIAPTARFFAAAKVANHRTFGPRRCRVALSGGNTLIAVMARGWSSVGGGARANSWPDEASALRYLVADACP